MININNSQTIMSKNNNNNTLKNPKSQHKRNNSNSYTSGSINSNVNANFNYGNTINNSEMVNTVNTMNMTGNIGGLSNMNISDLNLNQNINLQNSNLNNPTNNIPNNQNSSSPKDDKKSLPVQQKVDCVGKIPTARFGHTVVLVSPVKVILFGGAVGDTRNFQFTNDTYVLNLITKIWLKLEGKLKH